MNLTLNSLKVNHPLDYVRMIQNGTDEVLAGTLDLRVFAVSAEMAAREICRLLNEAQNDKSKSK